MQDQVREREEALTALRAGRYEEAFNVLRALSRRDPGDYEVTVGLMKAARAVGDHTETISAADRVLEREPRNLAALIAKADALFALRDLRTAGPFYLAALNMMRSVPAPTAKMKAEMERISKRYEDCMSLYESYLRDIMDRAGFPQSSNRIAWEHAIDILFGKRKIYHQEPHRFYFPYLPQRQFYEADEFDWTGLIEAGWQDVRAELLDLLSDQPYERAFRPYLEATTREPQTRNVPLRGNNRWGAYYIWRDGELIADARRRCPRTVSLLAHAPIPEIPRKAPSVLFSALQPRTHIPPHHGLLNTRLICHLPLIVPDGCWLRVGNEKRQWEPGKLLIFDDSIEHEAMNPTDELRVILLFEIWRPELTRDDREFVTTIFQAIEEFSPYREEGRQAG